MMDMEREKWNMKGNTQKFLSAEKAYKDAYKALVGPMPIKQSENHEIDTLDDVHNRWTKYLSQPLDNKDAYNTFISKAEALTEVIGTIIPQDTKLNFVTSVLNKLSNNQPNQKVLSCICYHSVMTDLCEFVHLHREPEKFKTGYMLVAKANKHLGLGFVHYAGIANNLIRLATADWTEKTVEEVVKLLGRNIFRPNPVYPYREYLERALPLAELAYHDYDRGIQLTSVKLVLSNGYEINGRFHLPLSLKGYIANADCTERTIVGFRGTDTWVNWITDITQYLVGSSLVYKMALGLLLEIHAQKGDRLLAIGHSLGGGLTQYSVAGLNVGDVIGMCYNSAGLSDIALNELAPHYHDNIWHLHLNYDQVYLIGNQLGNYCDMSGGEINPVKAHYLSTMRRHVSIGRLPYYRLN